MAIVSLLRIGCGHCWCAGALLLPDSCSSRPCMFLWLFWLVAGAETGFRLRLDPCSEVSFAEAAQPAVTTEWATACLRSRAEQEVFYYILPTAGSKQQAKTTTEEFGRYIQRLTLTFDTDISLFRAGDRRFVDLRTVNHFSSEWPAADPE